MTGLDLRHAETDAEVAACFPVMTLLRPHLTGADELVARVGRQRDGRLPHPGRMARGRPELRWPGIGPRKI